MLQSIAFTVAHHVQDATYSKRICGRTTRGSWHLLHGFGCAVFVVQQKRGIVRAVTRADLQLALSIEGQIIIQLHWYNK